jgi:hypothetical protein
VFELASMWLVFAVVTVGADVGRAAKRRLGPRLAPIAEQIRTRVGALRDRIAAWREARRPPPQLPPARIWIRTTSWLDRFQAGPDD